LFSLSPKDFSKEEEEELARSKEYKDKLDILDAQIQELGYEKETYSAEIEQCRQYRYSSPISLSSSFSPISKIKK
jgi:hypothetical protein